MLVLEMNPHVEFIEITGPNGEYLRLMPWDVPWSEGQIMPLVVDGQRIGTMLGFANRQVGFEGVPRCWQIVRSNARVTTPKGAIVS